MTIGWWHWWTFGDIWVFQQGGGGGKGETEKALDPSRAVTARGWSSRYCFKHYLLHIVHWTLHISHHIASSSHRAIPLHSMNQPLQCKCNGHCATASNMILCTLCIVQYISACTFCYLYSLWIVRVYQNLQMFAHFAHFALSNYASKCLCHISSCLHSPSSEWHCNRMRCCQFESLVLKLQCSVHLAAFLQFHS